MTPGLRVEVEIDLTGQPLVVEFSSKAETRRRQDSGFGKMLATRVRRRNSRLTRSRPLVVRSRVRLT